MTNKKPVIPYGTKHSKEYIYAALRSANIPQIQAYKTINPEENGKDETIRRKAGYLEKKEKYLFAVNLVEKDMMHKYGKIHYRDVSEVKIRDKELMILEINEKIDSKSLDNKQELEYRKLLSDLLQMKKEEEKENPDKEKAPTIYLPDKHKLIKACNALRIPSELFLSKLGI